MVGQLRFVVIVEGAGLRGSQRISQYLSTLGRWWNHMLHCWLSAPSKLIDEETTSVPSKRALQGSLVMVLGATGWIGVAGELLPDKQGRDWLMNHWGSLNG
jgi:hypothetical protein